MNCPVVLIPPEKVREVWKYAKPHLQSAIDLSHGRWTADYVLASLVLNEQQLWVVFNGKNQIIGAVTSQVATYPERTMLTIHFLGGDNFDEWYQGLLDTMTRYAKDTGCSGIECVARGGFWKWFKQDGFTKESVFYEKRV